MHQQRFEHLLIQDSAIHRLPAGTKMGIAGILLVIVLAIPGAGRGTGGPKPSVYAWCVLALVAIVLLAIATIAHFPWRPLLKRLLLLEPLALSVACVAFLQPHGTIIFLWLVARTTLCLLVMVLLAATTPFNDELEVLRRLRVPALMVTTLALMYRYLHVLQDEALRMRRARACRTFTPAPGAGRQRIWVLHAGVAGQLFLRSVDRAERIYVAMCARGGG